MKLGKKTVNVLSLATGGASLSAFGTYRLTAQFNSALRRGLVEQHTTRRDKAGRPVYVLTAKGRTMLDAYVAEQSAGYDFPTITDEML